MVGENLLVTEHEEQILNQVLMLVRALRTLYKECGYEDNMIEFDINITLKNGEELNADNVNPLMSQMSSPPVSGYEVWDENASVQSNQTGATACQPSKIQMRRLCGDS